MPSKAILCDLRRLWVIESRLEMNHHYIPLPRTRQHASLDKEITLKKLLATISDRSGELVRQQTTSNEQGTKLSKFIKEMTKIKD